MRKKNYDELVQLVFFFDKIKFNIPYQESRWNI